MSPTPDWVALRAAAAEAARRSYSPYSGFPVGAAALLADGSTISAANVENASYTVGICAETALVGVLVAGGHGRGGLIAVAVTDPDGNDLSACGRCRQLLHEMGGGPMPLNERPMDDWLPGAFGPEDLT